MGIIVTKSNVGGRLQGRIATELKEKNKPALAEEVPDFVDDSKYLRDYKRGNRQKFVLIVLVTLVVAALGFLITRMAA
jgi:hypothetical protein